MEQKKKTVKKIALKKKTKTRPAVKVKSSPIERIPVRPLGDRIVVRPLTDEETGTRSAFGIIIPETISKEKPEQGIVMAVGVGRYDDGDLIPVAVSVGDRILFSKYGFDEVKVGGKEYFIVSEGSVLAVIKE